MEAPLQEETPLTTPTPQTFSWTTTWCMSPSTTAWESLDLWARKTMWCPATGGWRIRSWLWRGSGKTSPDSEEIPIESPSSGRALEGRPFPTCCRSRKLKVLFQSHAFDGCSVLILAGLFDAAIVQSGNSENLWALSTRARQAAFQVGYNLGIPALLSRSLVERLRATDAQVLQRTAASVLSQVRLFNCILPEVWGL